MGRTQDPSQGWTRGRRRGPMPASPPPARPRADDLCSTCGAEATCRLPRQEGGVWHCEAFVEVESSRAGRAGAGRPSPPTGRPGADRSGGQDPATGSKDHSNGKAGTMSGVGQIVDKHRGERGELIAILEEIQAKYSYLPEEALRVVAERTGRSLIDIYGVATFYSWFSLKPRGKHLVTCCLGTACHVRGAPRIADELARQLGVRAGRDDPRRRVHARDAELPRRLRPRSHRRRRRALLLQRRHLGRSPASSSGPRRGSTGSTSAPTSASSRSR